MLLTKVFGRKYSTAIPTIALKNTHKAWQVHEYGGPELLQLGDARLPVINHPRKVLVQVHSVSLNPIDSYMIAGYGRTLLKVMRQNQLELPLTVGRDFSGVVAAKGLDVRNDLNIGDEVYGFIPLYNQGSFAESVLVEDQHLLPKPKHLTDNEAASLVYATMTAWSSLFLFGNLLFKKREGLRVLILGASGGVGTTAVQLLKSQDCTVFGTCSSNALDLVYSLGADCVFNYNDPDFEQNVALENKYHIVLDCAKIGYKNIPKSWKYDTYITLNSPLLINTDQYGLIGGGVRSLNDLIEANCGEGKQIKWGFFMPSEQGFKFIDSLIKQQKIKPVIHKVFPFNHLPEAFEVLSEGHLRGKIVIDYKCN